MDELLPDWEEAKQMAKKAVRRTFEREGLETRAEMKMKFFNFIFKVMLRC